MISENRFETVPSVTARPASEESHVSSNQKMNHPNRFLKADRFG